MRFSQKISKTPVREIIQLENIDPILENKLWNNILVDFFSHINNFLISGQESRKGIVCKIIWSDFFNNRIDEIPKMTRGNVNISQTTANFKNWFFSAEWYEQYDFIEFISQIDKKEAGTGIAEKFNISLKTEMSGYRIINNSIVQITADEEILEIEEAISFSDKFKSVNTHLNSALYYLSNRETPDYRNSVKESISAIESLCVIITGEKNTTLGQALGIIEKNYEIHGALKKAFSSLYGYTSDSGGIRHKLLEDDIDVHFEDAKFMLVSCSAFINYLKVKVETTVANNGYHK